MIDWHSHILPGIDDGSNSVNESVAMLKLLSEQGVTTVVATPHFYVDSCSPEKFLKNRRKSYESLKKQLCDGLPEILLGAEVCYYPGISKLSGLKDLCIQGTDILLVEMPMVNWTEHTVNEILELACSGEYTVVIAHIDRYTDFTDEATVKRMCKAGVVMQMNASCVNRLLTRNKAFKMLRSGMVRLIGSDCHNTGSRKPEIGKAFMYIRKKFGDEFISQMNDFGYSMIN